MIEITFGEWLKRQRNSAGLTQEQLARQIHCSTSALRKFESEERRPSPEVVEQLANIFNIPQEEHKSFLRFTRGDWQAFGNQGTEAAPWHVSNIKSQSNLPSSISSFIGRETEQSEVVDLLKKNRLVTLAGIGGIGKTRLAIQVGYQLRDNYPDGVWFIPLDSLSEPSLVPQTVASAFDIREGADRTVLETLKFVLLRKTLLLILDNCEHLLKACAGFINNLLIHCPDLKVLTTSRETLNLTGEAIYYLPSLSIPQAGASLESLAEYEAVELFIERAALTLPTFKLTEENAQAIVDICRRVDGIPLALELTAACVNILNVDEISKQLVRSFALLSSNQRSAFSRHQTLQASLDWSWSLLTEEERVFLSQLSVFAGGWILEAAEAVCDGDPLPLINSLVQKSLIKVKQEMEHETRYYFHEMVRQYAREKLGETGEVEEIRNKHLAYYVKLSEQAEPELYRSNQVFWLNKLGDELDNIRMAIEWALTTDSKLGLRLIINWAGPWGDRGPVREVRGWLKQFLKKYPGNDALRVRALVIYGNILLTTGDQTQAQIFARQGLELARSISDEHVEAFSLWGLGAVLAGQGDVKHGIPMVEQSLVVYQALGDKLGQANALDWLSLNHDDLKRSQAYLIESLRLYRDLGHLWGIAYCLNDLGQAAIWEGDFSSASQCLMEARVIFHELGNPVGNAFILNSFGTLAYWQGDYQQACSYFEEAISLFEKVGNSGSSWPRIHMAYVFLRQGDLKQAMEMFEHGIQQFQKEESVIGMVYTIEGLASLYVIQGQLERATQLLAWTDTRREELGNHRPPIEQMDVDKDITACLTEMGEAAFSDAYEVGKKMSLEEAVEYALEES